MPMCELGELSGIHTLSSTSTLSSKMPLKTPLKTHRTNNNLNVIEAESISSPRRVNDMSLGECQTTGIHLASSSSPYSSPNVLGQQPLNLLSKNSASDPLLSTSTLSSMTSNAHRVNGSNVAEGETAQHYANDASSGECQAANTGVHSPSSFYLSPTLNLSSSSSSSSDSGVSIVLPFTYFQFYVFYIYIYIYFYIYVIYIYFQFMFSVLCFMFKYTFYVFINFIKNNLLSLCPL